MKEWKDVEKEMPEKGARDEIGNHKLYLICHYNNFREVALYDEAGEWFSVSPFFSQGNNKLSQEGQPDYWMDLPEPPKK
jgi:hypothetical protein